MLNKKKGNLPKLNAKFSDHKLALSNEYKIDKAIQKDGVMSYLEMRPQSYARVFNDLFKASNLTLFIFHALSFILCFPLIFSMVWQYVLRNQKAELKPLIDAVFADPVNNITNLSFILALAITLLVVGLLEYWQHKTLKSCFKIHYQESHSLPPTLVLIALMFSAVSVGSSGYGAFEVVEVSQTVDPALIQNYDVQIADAMRSRKATNSRSTELLLSKDRELEYLRQQRQLLFENSKGDAQKYSHILLIISLVIEVMIFYTTRSIFAYMYRTMQDVLMFDDFTNGRNFLNLNVAELENAYYTPPDNNNTKSTDRINQEKDVPHRASTAEKSVNVFDLIKSRKTSNDSTQTAAILIEKPKKVKQPKSFVPTKEPAKTVVKTKRKSTGKKFKENELKNYLKIYEKKVQTSKTPKAVQDNKIRVLYIKYALSTFAQKQENGLVFFDVKDAHKWHKQNSNSLS